MALNSIQKEWEGFATMIFAKTNPSLVQRLEMRKAFFAGAWTMFCQMKEIGKPHVPEAVGLAHLNTIEAECKQYSADLMKEYSSKN